MNLAHAFRSYDSHFTHISGYMRITCRKCSVSESEQNMVYLSEALRIHCLNYCQSLYLRQSTHCQIGGDQAQCTVEYSPIGGNYFCCCKDPLMPIGYHFWQHKCIKRGNLISNNAAWNRHFGFGQRMSQINCTT